ncbi:uncharacterized protein LOC134690806 [Mytilus trossulus]|uniref:uncharacterized protein LOC134690806 n=1 Tax=Mytilus trossulus TaxID=6551 RepID=UPI00300510F8
MNRKPKNDQTDCEHNVYELGKVHFWEKYGVQRFPYRGRRRYSPCVYQSVDGGTIISNDVFGLTIRQFERMFKACLIRRKTHEQYILNLRYPDKTSDEYLEYLHDSKVCNKENLSWTESSLKDKYLYEHLVSTAGTEIDIRTRQQLFITDDMIQNATWRSDGNNLKVISSGSLAEGLDLPGSDMDIMVLIENVDVIRDVRNIKHPVQITTLLMENNNDHPGFTRLRLIAGGNGESFFIQNKCFQSTRQGLYLSVNLFVNNINRSIPNMKLSSHGPCLSDDDQSVDIAYCLRSKYLPYNAIPWASRHRLQWPPNSVIDKIKNGGCLLVPIGPKNMPDCTTLWRLSFSVAEKQLVYSFNYTQLLCYCLLKLTLKHIVYANKDSEGLLCSYFLKTALFWVSEEVDIDTFQLSQLYSCFCHCLSKMILWVNKCYCPNYFIPEHNMFLGKINADNNKILINVMYKIKCDGIHGLINSLFQYEHEHHRLLGTQLEPSIFKVDLLFYRICFESYGSLYNISSCLKLLEFIEYLLKSKSCTFIVDVCKWRHSKISQCAAQRLPLPTVTTEMYNIHKRYHRHLQDGIKADAVSGWLLYASFYYVSGQFNVTLSITDYVLSKCLTDMIAMNFQKYHEQQINYYRNHVHSTMTLQNKMRIAVVNDVKYLQHSSLIPQELKEEVKDRSIFLTPIVLSHCLRFLCYHHIGNISNRQHALRDLNCIVKETNYVDIYRGSDSLTILGVCYEISGDKNAAYQCYDEALQFSGVKSATAEARRSKLLTDLV